MNELTGILALSIFVCFFGAALLFVSSLFGPKEKQSAIKKSSYECGVDVRPAENTKISVKFYLTAILFILFDIEIIFMYPWAIVYTDFLNEGHGLYILGAMAIFIFIFVVGLIWEVKSKALEWD